MVTTTSFNPIIDQQDLRTVRLSGLRSPGLGTALVLEQRNGPPLLIWPGEPVQSPRLGRYRRMSVVDMNQYRITIELNLPSRDPSFLFRGALSFACQVRRPEFVVHRGISDVTAAIRPSLMMMMRPVAHDYDISESNIAESRLREVLSSCAGDDAIAIGGYLVELSSGAGALHSNAEWHDNNRKIRLDGVRRDAMSATARGGQDALIQDWLANHGGDPGEVLQWLAAGRAVEAEQMLDAMRIMAAGEDVKEPFNMIKERRKIVEHFVSGGATDGQSPSRSRLTGSLSKSFSEPSSSGRGGRRDRLGAPGPDREATPAEPAAPAGDKKTDKNNGNRVRGVRNVEGTPNHDQSAGE